MAKKKKSTIKLWIGDVLRIRRVTQKLTQTTLGGVGELSQSAVSRIESCDLDPGFHSTLAMMRYMGMKVSDVVDDDGNPTKEPN